MAKDSLVTLLKPYYFGLEILFIMLDPWMLVWFHSYWRYNIKKRINLKSRELRVFLFHFACDWMHVAYVLFWEHLFALNEDIHIESSCVGRLLGMHEYMVIFNYENYFYYLQVVMALQCRGEHVLGGLHTGINPRHIFLTSKMVITFLTKSPSWKNFIELLFFKIVTIFLNFKIQR